MTRAGILVLVSTTMFPLSACGCDEDAYRQATLVILTNVGLYPIDESGCGWLSTCSDQDIVEARQRAKDIRAFSAAHPQDECAQERYESWAHFVEYEADAGEHELKTHQKKNEYDTLEHKGDDITRRTREIEKKLGLGMQR